MRLSHGASSEDSERSMASAPASIATIRASFADSGAEPECECKKCESVRVRIE